MVDDATQAERQRLFEQDLAHGWHPFTPMDAFPHERPLMVQSAQGHELVDMDGRTFLDGVGSLWCNLLGHRHPRITAAIRMQLDRVAHSTFLGNSQPVAVRLAARLVALAPTGLRRVFFSDNGSTAVEVALKMALQYHQQSGVPGGRGRSRFLSLVQAYHGDTVGAVSLGGIPAVHDRFDALRFEVIRAPSPYCYRCPLDKDSASCAIDCADEVVRLIEDNADSLAAVVLEPGFQGAAGIITYPEGFLRTVAKAAETAGALLILDEVASGMGRSGQLFVADREGLRPDLLCIAKGLTGGYLPLAATLATETIYQAFLGAPEAGRTFLHGHTFTGNQLGAAAALATLDALEEERVLENLPALVDRMATALAALSDHPLVGDIRQYGLAAGIELVACRETKTPFSPRERVGMRVCGFAQDRGVFLRPLGDTLVLMPSLNISIENLDRIVTTIRDSLDDELERQRTDMSSCS